MSKSGKCKKDKIPNLTDEQYEMYVSSIKENENVLTIAELTNENVPNGMVSLIENNNEKNTEKTQG